MGGSRCGIFGWILLLLKGGWTRRRVIYKSDGASGVKFLPCSCSFFLSSLSSFSLRLAFAFRCDFSLHGSALVFAFTILLIPISLHYVCNCTDPFPSYSNHVAKDLL